MPGRCFSRGPGRGFGPGFGRGPGKGLGPGYGWGRGRCLGWPDTAYAGYYPYQSMPYDIEYQDELCMLKEQARMIKEELDIIEKRISEMNEQQQEQES
ncbi:MAG: DUF5320 domain-containing protein [Clostridiales bacterium]|nr:DUF5320 domain-containing protein [Clostridiales bacterium]MCF8022256.1 DUF5320 domain-containing protein [Clostridiales bacterium]